MTRLSLSEQAPDFMLHDVTGAEIHLSNFQERFIVLALLRGFT